MNRGIFWFRRDLRLADNAALSRAVESHDELLLVHVDEKAGGDYDASRSWLRKSLAALGADIERRGGRLFLLAGDPETLLPRLAAACGASAVHVSSLQDPESDARDARMAAALSRQGVKMLRAGGYLLTDADQVRSKSDAPYRVFTPFFKAASPTWRHRPRVAPGRLVSAVLPEELAGHATAIDPPRPRWDDSFWRKWSPGEAAAHVRLDAFLDRLDDYTEARDHPGLDVTSRLSPHLHFGEISPGHILEAARARGGAGAGKFVTELGWREFAGYVLQHWPDSVSENFNRRFDALPWRADPAALEDWKHGRTGVPLVDAGMRQLWHEGWMHNRVRMVVASWLTKHIGIDWREGAAWFMQTLVDADVASNTLGWQWVAGTGVDASPYFRIFNPVMQSRKFDRDASYLRRWLPELAGLDDDAIHAPWETGRVPRGYPAQPNVDLATGRREALDRFASINGAGAP